MLPERRSIKTYFIKEIENSYRHLIDVLRAIMVEGPGLVIELNHYERERSKLVQFVGGLSLLHTIGIDMATHCVDTLKAKNLKRVRRIMRYYNEVEATVREAQIISGGDSKGSNSRASGSKDINLEELERLGEDIAADEEIYRADWWKRGEQPTNTDRLD